VLGLGLAVTVDDGEVEAVFGVAVADSSELGNGVAVAEGSAVGLDVDVASRVGSGVGGADAWTVGSTVWLIVGDEVRLGDTVWVGEFVLLALRVDEQVGLCDSEGVEVGVELAELVGEGVDGGVLVDVGVGVAVALRPGVGLGVADAVILGVGLWSQTPDARSLRSPPENIRPCCHP
jgi:hypothetical protein